MNRGENIYPVVKHNNSSVLVISIFIAVFLYILMPFGMDGYDGNRILFSLGFGLCSFIVLFFFNNVIKNKIISKNRRWMVYTELFYIVSLLAAVTIFNYIYVSCVMFKFKFSLIILLKMTYYTFSFGIIPSTILFFVKYNKYLSSRIPISKDKEETFIEISSGLSNAKKVKIPIDEFIYAESQRNNVIVYYLHYGELVSKSIRITITKVAENIKSTRLFRCHKSFIINPTMIESVKGNSNGYKIKMKNINTQIVVSRNYVKEFVKIMPVYGII